MNRESGRVHDLTPLTVPWGQVMNVNLVMFMT